MLQVTGANEVVILLGFDVRIGEHARNAQPVHPGRGHRERWRRRSPRRWHRTRRQPTPLEKARLHVNLGRVPLPVTTLLETRLAAREAAGAAAR